MAASTTSLHDEERAEEHTDGSGIDGRKANDERTAKLPLRGVRLRASELSKLTLEERAELAEELASASARRGPTPPEDA